jgi:uncharacterized membrane protein YhaH (DUF805 family)
MNPFTRFFVEPITRQYADFNGVASREAFWMYVLFYILIGFAVGVVTALTHVFALPGLYQLALLLPWLAIGVRRLHDAGYSGWWQLLHFVPIVGWIGLLILFCQPSRTPPYST